MNAYTPTSEEKEMMDEAIGAIEKGTVEFLPVSKRTKPISIKMDEDDLKEIKVRANRDGLPYQTWIKSMLHKVLSGDLVHIQ